MTTNIVVKSPNRPYTEFSDRQYFIFTAGSIEMGKAEDWQAKLVNMMEDTPDLVFLNPRRDDWDSSWEQKITNPKFKEQVEWELDHLHLSDFIVMYLQPGTMSPISLLELGLHARDHKMLICCPDEFWRKGNVDIVAERFQIPVFTNLEDMVDRLKFLIGYHRQGEYE